MRRPGLRLASLELHDLPLYVEQPNTGNGSRGPHLGMEVLRRFNTAIDLRTDVAYFVPNRSVADPYRASYRSNRWWVVPALGTAALVFVVLAILRRRRARARAGR
jgi:hypothetical protein